MNKMVNVITQIVPIKVFSLDRGNLDSSSSRANSPNGFPRNVSNRAVLSSYSTTTTTLNFSSSMSI